EAETDAHLWAETYDRNLEDIFAIQSEVAERIARSLRSTLTPAERSRIESRPTESVEAYQWFLKGRQLMAKRTSESIRRAIEAFDRAVGSDPRFALAWAHRAEAFALLPFYTGRDLVDSVAEARRSARRALEIDPDLGEPHAALGLAARNLWEWDEAERELRRALELAPGYVTARHWYGLILNDRGRYHEAIVELEGALELDPLSLPLHMALGATHYRAGRYHEAERVFRRTLEFEPHAAALYFNLAGLLLLLERYDEAIEAMEAGARFDPEKVPPALVEEVRLGYEAGGATGFWEAYLEGHRTRPDLTGRGDEMALALTRLGRLDEAMEIAERAFDEREPHAYWIVQDPRYAPLRSHPRYPALRERLGLG
ncbi:MAG: tetratricopeptide repeat protein, partial [Gemmatimonadetes bacterium]|nr:tetratricopeptide repeat protein [Gemmatimonadota bacterium]